jgi:sterol desaturase/sphingolipid hydroxylase (fatty acid hydroxylase superfamily)
METNMTLPAMLENNLATIAAISVAMALVAALEVAIPLHARGRWHRAHVGPNLALTGITFALGMVLNGGLLLLLAWLEARDLGVFRWVGLPPLPASIAAVVLLDLSFYVAHVAMHKVPDLWAVHRVHHSDPVVDVTTTIRQHPAEGLVRYAFMAAFACALGVGLGAFAVYRAWSALSGLLEHANLRIPRRLDRVLALVTTWPNMHKVHHSRDARETDTNYGNLFPWFDRLFGTYTPSSRGESVVCGLDGLDDPQLHTTRALLALPLARTPATPTRGAPHAEAA